MNTKLTLTIDKAVIEDAKAFAKAEGQSLSLIIENYLISLSKKSQSKELSPNVKKLVGSVKLPENFDYKKELTKALTEKYLRE